MRLFQINITELHFYQALLTLILLKGTPKVGPNAHLVPSGAQRVALHFLYGTGPLLAVGSSDLFPWSLAEAFLLGNLKEFYSIHICTVTTLWSKDVFSAALTAALPPSSSFSFLKFKTAGRRESQSPTALSLLGGHLLLVASWQGQGRTRIKTE